ncbi:MAG: xanthine dehydrogenase family protein molybdopterin-binding subunit [Acidobacteria bacterium]|nr:xanthine dehydrogenase family protein molybdopterin-binding subunit [Acidobacteriota bacterium]
MANTPVYNWPPMNTRKVIGKPLKRLDGPVKASGRAKYGSDKKFPGMLFATYLGSPHAHARVNSIDTSEAEKIPGVRAVHVITGPGKEIQWQGTEVAAVAADTEEIARDAVRRIKVDYEVLPHFVDDANLSAAGSHGKAAGEVVQGDPDKAIQEAEVVSDGTYGIPIVTHCCLEPHGCVISWKGDQVEAWPSTQFVTGWAGTLAPNLKVPAANIHVLQDYIGGGFGSKFAPGAWAEIGAILSQKAGGRPVKIFLERNMELEIAGHRPSAYGNIKIAGKKDGSITAWQSSTWASGGFPGAGSPPLPYVYSNIPNQRRNHVSVSTNIAGSQAWRAPNNQQASFLTCSALEDFAAKAGVDPMEVFRKNLSYTPRAELYGYQLDKAAELSEWKKLWKPRGSQTGALRRGLGMGVNAWGGGGHACTARTTINPDGSVLLEMGTQDLGTGTRTVMVQVAAETLGLQPNQVKLVIGDNHLPPGGSSGGSTTVGGVSSATRKSSMNALYKLFDAVAPAWNVQPEQLEAVDGQIRVKGTPGKSMTWAAACKKIAPGSKIQETGANEQRNPMGLNTAGVGGVQVADVTVDTETGQVRVNRFVAVQDCGLIINPRLAESQCYGGIIMGISTALLEERITDNETGHMLNADMEFYKLAGIRDVGDIVVHLDIREENDKRGVIGLGEPPAIAICAAIGNAVANAIGMRVPHIPMTPMHVLNTLEGRKA